MKMKPFRCENRIYKMPEKHCAFCKHCIDFYYDYTHGPYLFICEKDGQGYENCNQFEEEDGETE